MTAGEVVCLRDRGGGALGTGFYSSESVIAVRRASLVEEPLDGAFIRRRLAAALGAREAALGGLPGGFRWVHAEADGVPGLVVDCLGSALAVQVLCQGTARLQEEILGALCALRHVETVVLRNDAPSRDKEGLPREKRLWQGTSAEVELREGDVTLHVDLMEGQKTGTFLDQRDNHLLAGRLARGEALDCFTGDGGFALQAARGCTSVLAVDSSASATARVARNARSNGLSNVTTRTENVFDLLRAEEARGARYDTVVLDPPAFAKGRRHLEPALRGYKELNLRGLRLLRPGGLLVTCSCSQPVTTAVLEGVLHEAAVDARRAVQVLHRRGAGPDHPVLLGFPESDYLSCVVARLTDDVDGRGRG
jgi:23S rRNA (cytosine1962-C5)-methyltransferase